MILIINEYLNAGIVSTRLLTFTDTTKDDFICEANFDLLQSGFVKR